MTKKALAIFVIFYHLGGTTPEALITPSVNVVVPDLSKSFSIGETYRFHALSDRHREKISHAFALSTLFLHDSHPETLTVTEKVDLYKKIAYQI